MADGGNVIHVSVTGSDTLSETLAHARTNANSFGDSMKRVGEIAAGVFAARSIEEGAQKVVEFLGSSVREAEEAEIAQTRLKAAVEASGASFDEFAKPLAAAGEEAKRLGFSDEAAARALALLTAQTGSAEEAMKRLSVAQNLSRGTGLDLETASRLLGKITEENVQVLKRYGITLHDGATETEALAEVQKRFGGQAEAFADSAAGAMARYHEKISDVKEVIGTGLIVVLGELATVAVGAINAITGPAEILYETFSNMAKAISWVVAPLKGATTEVTSYDDAVAKLAASTNDLEKRVLTDLIKKWDEARAATGGYSEATAQAEQAQDALKASQDRLKEGTEAIRQTWEGATGALQDYLFTLLGAADQITISNTGSGRNIVSATPLANVTSGIQQRASGGPVSAGNPYWVGERGVPELFVPDQSGTIVPAGGAGGTPITINVYGSVLDTKRDIVAAVRDEILRGGFRGVLATP